MRTPIEVYDKYLSMQADASFWIERSLYEFERFKSARTIVDLGCGNAHYAARIAREHPRANVIGIDSDSSILACAKPNELPTNLQIMHGSFDTVAPELIVDVLVSRLVTMYLSDPEQLANWAKRAVTDVIIIDAADDLFYSYPNMPLFAQTEIANAERIKKMGGDREVVNRIVETWETAGFSLVKDQDIIVQSTSPLGKYHMHHMLRLHAELAVGSPLHQDLTEEIFAWSLHPEAYLQYGLRARHFVNEDGPQSRQK